MDYVKQHENALESARRLRTVLETLSKNTSTPKPALINADQVAWFANEGRHAEINALGDRVGFTIYDRGERPIYFGVAMQDQDLQRVTTEFGNVLKEWQR